MKEDSIKIPDYIGTWYVIDKEVIDGKKLYLLEHEDYGDETAGLIIDENYNVVLDDVWNGFDDYREFLEID